MIAAEPVDISVAVCPNCGNPTRIARLNCTTCGSALGGMVAGVSRRAGAFLIDVAVACTVALILQLIAAHKFDVTSFDATATTFAVIGAGLYVAYVVGLNAFGGTLGKRLLGLHLVARDSRSRLGLGRSAVRFITSLGSLLALGAGYLFAWSDPMRQTWHDKAAGSIVTDTRPHSGWHWVPIAISAWYVIPMLAIWQQLFR